MSGIAWRLTATEAPSCRALLGIGVGAGPGFDYDEFNNNGIADLRFLPRGGGASGGGGAAQGGANVAQTCAAARTQHPFAGG